MDERGVDLVPGEFRGGTIGFHQVGDITGLDHAEIVVSAEPSRHRSQTLLEGRVACVVDDLGEQDRVVLRGAAMVDVLDGGHQIPGVNR